MLTINMLLFSLTIILLLGANVCHATVSCVSCPSGISIDITTDTDINTSKCILEEDDLCSLILRIDYINSNNSFAIMSGSKDAGLILTNGEPQVTETTFIWFDNDRVQRLANILCFSGSSCGLDLLKQLYREKFRSFGYETIQSTLAKQLYSSTAVSSELTCADPTGASVSCTNGFCRSAFDGNGLVSYSSCIKNGIVPAPYGLVVSKSTMADIDIEQSTIMYSCNKPMCNSIENTRQVLQQLIAAKLIPQSTGTTTTPKNTGIQLMKNYQEMFVSFLMIFLIFKI